MPYAQRLRSWVLVCLLILVSGPMALPTPDGNPDGKAAPKPPPDPKAVAKAAARFRELCKAVQADVDEIERLSRSRKARNDDLLQYVAAVVHMHPRLQPPAVLDGADRKRIEKDCVRVRKGIHAALVRCLTLERVRNEDNIRTEVNLAAAKGIWNIASDASADERNRLSAAVRRAVESHMLKVTAYSVAEVLFEETFLALARLGSLESLEWMLRRFVHTRPAEVGILIAAHKAMPLFEDVPGSLRFQLVSTFLKVYAPEEAKVARMPGVKRGAVLEGATAVVQHYAGSPRTSAGERLETLQALGAWFETNRNPRKAPWIDP